MKKVIFCLFALSANCLACEILLSPKDIELVKEEYKALNDNHSVSQNRFKKSLKSKPILRGKSSKVLEVIPNLIYNVRFDSMKEMTRTFLRFQEHYESPEFRKKIFLLKDYKEWYRTQTKSGKFTYFTDWGGFNIPSSVLTPFYRGDFKYLTAREKELLEFFREKYERGENFYIIGTYNKVTNDPELKEAVKNKMISTISHETAHALFYINADYRREALQIVNSLPKQDFKELVTYIRDGSGYHEDVVMDEVHAYLLCNWHLVHVKKGVFKSLDTVRPYYVKLREIFEHYLSLY